MIFDNVIYPDNKKKEKKIKDLEIELVKLFENYNGAWNEFRKVLNIEDRVPRLEKSIRNSNIEECLEEIDSATQELDNVIKNANQKLESEKLLGEIDYRLSTMQSETLRKAIKYMPLVTGGLGGIGVAALVCKGMMARYKELNNIVMQSAYLKNEAVSVVGELVSNTVAIKDVSINISKINWMFDNEYTSIFDDCLENMQIKKIFVDNYNKTKLYKNTYGRIDKLESEVMKKINLTLGEADKKLMIKEIDTAVTRYKAEIDDFLMEDHFATDSDVYMDKFIKEVKAKRNTQNFNKIKINTPEYEISRLDVGNAPDKMQKAVETKKGQMYFKTAIVGIVIIVAMVLILDAITCCIEGFVRSKELNKRLGQMNNIVGELTRTMGSETAKLIKLTQSIKDGVVMLDSEHMILVDAETSEETIVKTSDIE
ncbi:MAG: hypothetical protein ACRCSG_05190 [Cellulosilyticaceae bacterium]